MKKFLSAVLMLGLLAFAMPSQAVEVTARRLSVSEQAGALGANYLVMVKYSDFTTTATNTAETLTLPVKAGQGFTLLYAKVKTEFVGINAGTDSMGVIVGDDADDNQFLTSMEMATESSEVVGKFGMGLADGVFYEADDTIDFKFTPNAQNATSTFSAGEVWFYCKLVE